jgi:tetratricopeptide (TPR) repeat protein
VAPRHPPTRCQPLDNTASSSSARRRTQSRLRGIERFVLAGMLLALTGCGDFAAQQRNVQGVSLFQQGHLPEALREFQEATYSNPRDADGYYNIAATYHRLGRQSHSAADLQQAEKFYNDCLDRNPNHVECNRGLAVLLAEQGRKDAAFRLVQGWVDREPTLAEAKVELARLHDEFGNRQAAKDCLIEALEAQPDNVRALTALGKIRDEAGEKAQALANYQRSLERDNRQPQVASRVAVLQGGRTANSTPGSAPSVAPDGLGPPAVEIGTLIADRNKNPLQ